MNDTDRKPVEPVRETSIRSQVGRLLLAAGLVLGVTAVLYWMFRVDLPGRVQEMESHLASPDDKFRKLAAYELWKIGEGTSPEQRARVGILDGRVGQKLLALYRRGDLEEEETRRFLILALGYFGCQDALPDLVREVQNPGSISSDLRLDAVYSLGLLQNREAAGSLVEATRSENPAMRRAAAAALGKLGDPRAEGPLEALLEDTHAEVAWTAALALGELGNPAGQKSFEAMLDRQVLQGRPELDEEARSRIMIHVIRAVDRLKLRSFRVRLERLGETDPNLRVRSEAMRALRSLAGD
ncbi:MAG: HEAT repeat domain-containing protein [Planctomycetes bacterium]|nr:HEAT repeat domain-containing protein [Planctomycetota bacterium]